MATINFGNRQVSAKVVYCGSAAAGGSAIVAHLHEQVASDGRGPLHRLGHTDDPMRTSWYFDHMWAGDAAIPDFQLLVQVCSLPTGEIRSRHQDVLLQDADAVVFIADARPEHRSANLDALLHLETALSGYGHELASMPVVIHVSHTEGADAEVMASLTAELNPYGFPVVSDATTNLLATHEDAVGSTAARIRDNLGGNPAAINLVAIHRAESDQDSSGVARHMQAIEAPTTMEVDLTGHFEMLPITETIDVSFKPDSMLGMRPVHMLRAELVGEEIHLDVILEGVTDDQTRLQVKLRNRAKAAGTSTSVSDSVREYLPDAYDTHPPAPPRDMPSWAYGAIGIFGGVVLGVMIAYLLGFLT
jgi:hypothetical protein